MLLTRVRVSPCSERLSRSSSGRLTSRTSTPCSSLVFSTGSLPMRDIAVSPPGLSSPDVGEDFPTHALLVGLTVGEQPLAGRDDRDAEAAEHLRETGVLGVDAQTGLADPAYAGDRALA